MKTSSRVIFAILMLAALVPAGFARHWAIQQRLGAGGAATGARTSMGSMNSYALALLLGGLRGPLVMMLWANSETAKMNRDMEDLDTQIELIRLLQPEFDTVHVFQVWNKAYNISVQMASLDNRYTTILDAIEYARQVMQERPNNVTMVFEIGSIYTRKLGDSTESTYYKDRLRKETLPHQVEIQTLNRSDPGWRPLQHEQMVDERGFILPKYKAPAPGRTSGTGDPKDLLLDGSELQYLKPYEPYQYGLSAHALAYNYFRQAQALARTGKQKHATMSNRVLDSRSRVTLKMWATDEQLRGRTWELAAFGVKSLEGPQDVELSTASISLDQAPVQPQHIHQALDGYQLAARLAKDTIVAHQVHEAEFPDQLYQWQSQVEESQGLHHLALADAGFLQLHSASGVQVPDRGKVAREAAENYLTAKRIFQRLMLRYFTPDAAVKRITPDGGIAASIDRIADDQLDKAVEIALDIALAMGGSDLNRNERGEVLVRIMRADARIKTLSSVAAGN